MSNTSLEFFLFNGSSYRGEAVCWYFIGLNRLKCTYANLKLSDGIAGTIPNIINKRTYIKNITIQNEAPDKKWKSSSIQWCEEMKSGITQKEGSANKK